MPQFTDRTGRSWLVELDVTTMNRIRAKLDVDLYAALDDQFAGLRKLLEDLPTMCNVLYLTCEQQAKEKNVSDEDFGRALAGDTLENAAHAFVDALIDFFPQRKARTALQRAIRISREAQDQMLDHVLDGLDAIGELECWELAGIVGVHPGPFKLRELRVLAEGRMRHDWNVASSMMAWVGNIAGVNVKADDLNPFAVVAPQPASNEPEIGIEALKTVFIDRKPLSAIQ